MAYLAKRQIYRPYGVNTYVPRAKYHSSVQLNQPYTVSLGTPAAPDADGILDGGSIDNNSSDFLVNTVASDGVATATAFGGTLQEDDIYLPTSAAYFGQVLAIKTATGSTARTLKIKGADYLGQPVYEEIATSATTSAVVYTQKAFKVVYSVACAQASGAITVDIGWGNRLGLPLKLGRLLWGMEDGTIAPAFRTVREVTAASAVDVSGANASTLTVPSDGWLCGVTARITTALTTDFALMDFTLNGTGAAAMDFTIPLLGVGAQAGAAFFPEASWQAVSAGDSVAWTSDADPDAGAAILTAYFCDTKLLAGCILPDTTDPATATTGDPRGLYIAETTFDGSKEFIVRFDPDNAANSSGNGGLYGIQHYYPTS